MCKHYGPLRKDRPVGKWANETVGVAENLLPVNCGGLSPTGTGEQLGPTPSAGEEQPGRSDHLGEEPV